RLQEASSGIVLVRRLDRSPVPIAGQPPLGAAVGVGRGVATTPPGPAVRHPARDWYRRRARATRERRRRPLPVQRSRSRGGADTDPAAAANGSAPPPPSPDRPDAGRRN